MYMRRTNVALLLLFIVTLNAFEPVFGWKAPAPKCKTVFCNEKLFAFQRCNRELICGQNNIEPGELDVIPSPKGLFSPDRVPSDPKLTLAYEMDNIHGEHVPGEFTGFRVFLSGQVPGLAVVAKIFYDFNGDGSWDRTETFDIFTGMSFAGAFSSWTQIGPNSLRFIGGSGYRNFNNGKIKIIFWQPYGFSNVFLRTDRAVNGQLSFVQLPYISVSSKRCDCPLSPVSTITSLVTSFLTGANAITTTTSTTTSTTSTTSTTTNTGSTGTTSTSTSTGGNGTVIETNTV